MDETRMILDRIGELENNMKEYVAMCQQNCGAKLASVEEKVDKAHIRLDKHSDSIKCLDAEKHERKGFRLAVYLGLSVMGLAISYLALK